MAFLSTPALFYEFVVSKHEFQEIKEIQEHSDLMKFMLFRNFSTFRHILQLPDHDAMQTSSLSIYFKRLRDGVAGPFCNQSGGTVL